MAASEVTPVTINDRHYRQIREGQARILAPYQKDSGQTKKIPAHSGQPRNNDEGDQAVFYNPIQQYNRDLSVLAILIYGESATALKQQRHQKNVGRSRQKKAGKGKQGVSAKPTHLSEANTTQLSTSKGTVKAVEPSASDSLEANGTKSQQAHSSEPQIEADATRLSSKKRTAHDAELDTEIESASAGRKRSKDESADDLADVEVQQLGSGPAAPEGATAANETPGEGNTEPPQHEARVPDKRDRRTAFTILDGLSASGLRAVRYAKEIPFATKVVANDMLPEAVQAIKLNIEHNKLTDTVFANLGDARQFMYSKSGNEHLDAGPAYVHKFDVVDLDPYGSAAPFIDSALQAVADGGMLCVTCTDAGVWASNGYPEKTYALYNGIPLKGPHSHEAGMRLILHSIATTASKYEIAIEPLLSLSIDFYCRLFVRVHKSQQEVKLMAGTTMLVYNCDQGCQAWQTQLVARNQVKEDKKGDKFFKHGFAQAPSTDRFCDHCGTKTHLGGPMWAGPLHNPAFVQKILDRLPKLDKTVYGTTDRIRGMLTVALEEEDVGWASTSKPSKEAATSGPNGDVSSAIIPRLPPHLISESPFFFMPTFLARVLSLPTPTEDPLRGAILGLGYTCTRSHCKPGSLKTNAPWKVIWEVMREWARQKEGSMVPRLLGEGDFEGKASVKKSSPGWNILKRLRDRKGDTLSVARLREGLLQKLGNGRSAVDIENMADLQGILRSALYELEHPSASLTHKAVESSTTNGASVSPVDVSNVDSVTNGADAVNRNGESAISAHDAPRITGKALIDAGGDVSELEIVFDAQLGRSFRDSRGGKLVRYQMNPRANWGPMVRAGTGAA